MKLFLAGDSTCQAYGPDMAPQQGWGGVFYKYFRGAKSTVIVELTHEKPKAIAYQLPAITIENWSASARSSRSYIEEGRLEMFRERMEVGDYLFVQFAHNDSKADMPEKYVPPEDYPEWLERFRVAAADRGAIPVFLSSIAKRNAEEFPDGHFHYSFDDYRDQMMRFCHDTDSIFIDFGEQTMEYCEKSGLEATKGIYLHVNPGEYPYSSHSMGKIDNVHLNGNGAYIYAGILARLLKDNPDERLCKLDMILEL